MKIDPSELVSQQEAAKIRGVTIQAIYSLIQHGKFNTVEISGRKYLLRKEVEAFVPRRTGRPRKDSTAAKSSQASKAAKRSSASKTKSAKKRKAR